MRLPQLLIAAVAALAAAALPSAAGAMEVAMQDDLTIVNKDNNRNLALQQFAAMGGTTVRMTVEHARNRLNQSPDSFSGRLPTSAYDDAVAAVRSFGLRPQITLLWRKQADPQKLATWMNLVVAHFGGRVNRYSVQNEPDLYLPQAMRCTPTVVDAIERKYPDLFVRVDGELMARTKAIGRTITVARACQRYERGIQYKKVFNAAAPAIRRANIGTDVLAGETSATKGLDWFLRGADAPDLDADGWAHHPFQFPTLSPSKRINNFGIGSLKVVQRMVKMPIYLTEFAYPRPGGYMDLKFYGHHITEEQRATALTQAWTVAKRDGAKEMLQFLWFRKRNPIPGDWDTSIMNYDDDPSVTPTYLALQALIKSW